MDKTCNSCNISKPCENFPKNHRRKDGLDNKCKDCYKANYNKNKDKKLAANAKWRNENKDYIKEKARIMYDSRKSYLQDYYQQNKEKYIARKQEYRKNSPAKALLSSRRYREDNRAKVNGYARQYKKKLRLTDPSFKIRENISRRIRTSLQNINMTKHMSSIDYTGCSIHFLKMYLESKFNYGMTWKNYGVLWEIDHIIPCSSWNLLNAFDSYCCWNYRNLQPLWATENAVKLNKFSIQKKNAYITYMKTLIM